MLVRAILIGCFGFVAFAGALDTGTPVIIDNSNAEFVGKWYSTSEAADKYGADFRYSASSDGELTAVAVYRANHLPPGDYDVEIWYSAAENRSPNAHWVVCHSGRNTTARINQQINGGRWIKIAEGKHFSGTADECVFASNFGTKGTAIVADAVRFVPAVAAPRVASGNSAQAIVLDNDDAVFEGNWMTSTTSPQRHGKDYKYAVAVAGAATATAIYQPTIPATGRYDVEIFYPTGPNRSLASSWVVSCQGGTFTKIVNQKAGGGRWMKIGQALQFAEGKSGFVKLINSTTDAASYKAVVIADGVRFVPVR